MADNDNGEPGRGIVGADGAKGFAANAAIVDLLQIGPEQPAFAATGTFAEDCPATGPAHADAVFHGPNIVPHGLFFSAACWAMGEANWRRQEVRPRMSRKAWRSDQ